MHEPEALAKDKICNENQVLTIADEVMTGFGKTKTLLWIMSCTARHDVPV
jgi:adenosylmethionine-8-amino-7-oxononanoate aminotransferase